MPGRYSASAIERGLQRAELAIQSGASNAAAADVIGVTPATLARWRKTLSGLSALDISRLRGLERENASLRKRLTRLRAQQRISFAI